MFKAVLCGAKFGMMILAAYTGLNIPDLVANSKRTDPQVLTENGISINAAAPPMRELPPMGEALPLNW